MREDYYSDYYEFEQNNWWFVSRRKILATLLRKKLPKCGYPRQVLDAGCGTGINLAMLEEFGEVTGVDSSPEAIHFCHLRQANNAKQYDITGLPFENESYQLITALDVLEHIEDDEQAFREIGRVCQPEGYFLLTVPVFPSLWGEHDEINQHYRRYEPRRIYELLQSNGFTIEHRSFMNTWLLPAAFLWRGYRNLKKMISPPSDKLARADNMHHVPWMNTLLTMIFSSELPFVVGLGLPFGLSLVVLAKKEFNDRILREIEYYSN